VPKLGLTPIIEELSKVRRMKRVESKIETTSIAIVTCDFCGKEDQWRCTGIKQCKICKEDVCWECSEHVDIECNLLEPYFHSDYPEYICKPCWEKGKEIRKRIMKIRDEAEEKECELWEQWKKIKA